MKALSQVPIELIFWIIGLVLLAGAEMPGQLNEPHFTLCPLASGGFHWCPGCGLGRSITALFHGDFYLSIQLHWFGLPAFLILCYRISILTRLQLKRSWKNNF